MEDQNTPGTKNALHGHLCERFEYLVNEGKEKPKDGTSNNSYQPGHKACNCSELKSKVAQVNHNIPIV